MPYGQGKEFDENGKLLYDGEWKNGIPQKNFNIFGIY
jgi:antitoxin component YwqK of YwqJK toxin-antitoxin module